MKGKMFVDDKVWLTRKTTFKPVSKYVVDFCPFGRVRGEITKISQSFISCRKVELWFKGCSYGAIVTAIFIATNWLYQIQCKCLHGVIAMMTLNPMQPIKL